MAGDKGGEQLEANPEPTKKPSQTTAESTAEKNSRVGTLKQALSETRSRAFYSGERTDRGNPDLTPDERSRVDQLFGGVRAGEEFSDTDKRYDDVVGRVRSERPGAIRKIYSSMTIEEKDQIQEEFGGKRPDETMQEADARHDEIVRRLKFPRAETVAAKSLEE